MAEKIQNRGPAASGAVLLQQRRHPPTPNTCACLLTDDAMNPAMLLVKARHPTGKSNERRSCPFAPSFFHSIIGTLVGLFAHADVEGNYDSYTLDPSAPLVRGRRCFCSVMHQGHGNRYPLMNEGLTLSGEASTTVRAHASVAEGALLGSCRPPMQLQPLSEEAPAASRC